MRRVVQIVFPLFVVGMSLSLTRCGGESTTGGSTTGSACTNGICGTGGSTSASTSGGMGGMTTTGSNTTTTTGSNTTTTGASMTSGGGAGGAPGTTSGGPTTTTSAVTSTGSAGCTESWLCTPWDGAGTSNGTRVCTDINNCGTTVNKPSESATLPALDLSVFKCNVEPILDAKCSMLGCHGTETGRALRVYSRGKLRDVTVPNAMIPPNGNCTMLPFLACIGSNDCGCAGPHALQEWQRNYDAARGFALDAQGNPIPPAQAATSDMIQQPVVGGKSHAGVHLFKLNDAEYTTIKNWLSGSAVANCPVPNPN